MKIIHAATRPSRPADPAHFTGHALAQAMIGRDDGLPVRVYRVSFEAGARMRWHRHDDVQLLVGLTGTCVVASRAGEPVRLGPGDIVVVEPEEEHWHGASPDEPGSHFAINLGEETTWMDESW
jgi:quercetin dioxygenase-like cupin family protein